jgi:hypothetical protein
MEDIVSTSLSHSPADVLRWLLIAGGIGTDPSLGEAWPIYASDEPDLPDNLLTLYDTAGVTQGRLQETGETAEHRGVMVQIRGIDQPTTWAKADAARVYLDESVHNQVITVGASEYIVHAVTRKSGPISLGREPTTNRFLFTLNAVMSLRQIT